MLHGSRTRALVGGGSLTLLLLAFGSTRPTFASRPADVADALREFADSNGVIIYDFFDEGQQRIALAPRNGSLPMFVGVNGPYSPDFPVRPITICSTRTGHTFLSLRADCEGAGKSVSAGGFIFERPSPGLVPLYRCRPPEGSEGTVGDAMPYWTTTNRPEASAAGATESEILGYVLPPNGARRTPASATWMPIHSLVDDGDHALSFTKDEGGYRFERTEFFLTKEPTSADDTPLYRCNGNVGGHYADDSPLCADGRREARLGYIARSARPGFVALNRYFAKKMRRNNDRWVTVRGRKEMKALGYVLERELGFVSEKGLLP